MTRIWALRVGLLAPLLAPRAGSAKSHDLQVFDFIGGARRDRTVDLLHAMQALSQLSYGPVPDKDTSRVAVGLTRRPTRTGAQNTRNLAVSTRFGPQMRSGAVSQFLGPRGSAGQPFQCTIQTGQD